MLRLGIIGCGRIMEQGHSPALQELTDQAQVISLADPSPERRNVLGGIFAVPAGSQYESADEMLSSEELDVVDIATPHAYHEAAIVSAAKAGVHVISEKPLATDLDEVDRILEAVEAAGVKLCVLHNYRYGPPSIKARELIAAGAIGDVFLVRMEGLGGGHYKGATGFDPDWRTKSAKSGGGCLIDNAYHSIYQAREMMGSPVKSVFARVETYTRDIDVDDTAVLILNHENGGTSVLMVSWGVSAGGAGANEVHGTGGSIAFHRDGQPISLFDNALGEWSSPEPKADYPNSFAGIMHDAFDAIASGGKVPTPGAEARRNLEIIRAAYRSAEEGQVIEV